MVQEPSSCYSDYVVHLVNNDFDGIVDSGSLSLQWDIVNEEASATVYNNMLNFTVLK